MAKFEIHDCPAKKKAIEENDERNIAWMIWCQVIKMDGKWWQEELYGFPLRPRRSQPLKNNICIMCNQKLV